ncbi:multiheme c-type cytochrome [Desulfuromonas sp. AOP6]|uniref:multiheme c-type cytochrome n=1 Tax=Desulfuromonas sp. AOP6 TaxID=1566351 RepID=UPI0012765173|nr:multiheme c-type cytochrome [Desulfuromonas sp. AOP6]BCA80780.1 cytochrome c [Desulfuromonas sp. AOP6]
MLKWISRTGLMSVMVLSLMVSSGWAMENEDCLGCHAEADMVGADLVIEAEQFDHTAHAEIGCTSCHASVAEAHPDDGLVPTKASCNDCHGEVHEEYAASMHGDYAACTDCHNPHNVHDPTAVSGHDMNQQCDTCHLEADSIRSHAQWLPQAELHIGALACVACHTGSEEYVITWYIIKRESDPRYGDFELAPFRELQKLAGSDNIDRLLDTNEDGHISLAELKDFNSRIDLKNEGIRLKGMMMPEQVTHSFQILENRWDCSYCHASGPEAMQSSYVAFPRADNSYSRLPVEEGAVLDALNGTPDFYMVGATRNASLNLIGLAIIAGGLIMPIGHGTLRFLTRSKRQGKGH